MVSVEKKEKKGGLAAHEKEFGFFQQCMCRAFRRDWLRVCWPYLCWKKLAVVSNWARGWSLVESVLSDSRDR